MTTTTTATQRTLVTAIATAAGLALVANLAIFLIAPAITGEPIQVVQPGDDAASDLPVAALMAASIIPTAIGAVMLRFLADRGRLMLGVGVIGVFALLSLGGPLTLDIDTGSKVALSLMHLATASAVIVPALRGR